MSRIDELVAELCPEGVGFHRVGDTVITVSAPRGIKRENYGDGSLIPIIDQGQSKIAGYTDDKAASLPPDDYVVFGDHTCAVKWVDFAFAPGADGTKVFRMTKGIEPKFGYYAIKNLEIPSRGYNRHWTVLRELRIPIPPIEVQREIVKVLDTFTALTAELEAELEARRRQYQYYRDALLSYEFPSSGGVPEGRGGLLERPPRQASPATPPEEGNGVRWVALGEVATYSKTRIESSGLNADSYVGVDNLLPDMRGRTQSSYVPAAGSSIGYEAEDVLIGNIRPYLKKIWLADSSGGTNQDVLVIRLNAETRNEMKARFLYHLLASEHFFVYNMQYAKGAKMPRGDKEAIMRYEIPVPPISEQARIVAILDKFDALVNDLSAGLPAEIKARRQQYEHYRDRLLTFTEAT